MLGNPGAYAGGGSYSGNPDTGSSSATNDASAGTSDSMASGSTGTSSSSGTGPTSSPSVNGFSAGGVGTSSTGSAGYSTDGTSGTQRGANAANGFGLGGPVGRYGSGEPSSSTAGSSARSSDGGSEGGGSGGGIGANPLVLNLSGGAVHTTDLLTSGVSFDCSGNGHAVTTGWILPREAFLVEDGYNGFVSASGKPFRTFSQHSM